MKFDQHVHTSQAGVTLIELLVVIAIIGILSAVAVPWYFSMRPKHDLNRAVRDYYQLQHKAKMMAIKDRGKCTFTFTPSSYRLACTNSGYQKDVSLSEYNSKLVFNNPTGGSSLNNPVGGTDFPAGAVTFGPTGEGKPGYLYFTHSDYNEFYRVGPLISGVINLQHWNGAKWE